MAEKENDPLDGQIYYIGKNGITQIQIVESFNLDYHEGSALKYLLRRGAKKPNDIAAYRKDLEKAIWHLKHKLSVV